MKELPGRPRFFFSRAEWLLIAGLLLIAASVIIPALTGYRHYLIRTKIRGDIFMLLEASQRYFDEYGHWPTDQTGMYGDVRYGADTPNDHVIRILSAEQGEANPDHIYNLKKIPFLSIVQRGHTVERYDRLGALYDPWRRQYQIVVDTDLDGHCSMPDGVYGVIEGQGVVIWSLGPDGISGTQDDITSWELLSRIKLDED